MKKITSILLALVMVLSVMTVSIASVSAEIIDSGYFEGHEIYWTFDDTGTLTATGTGPLNDIFAHHQNDLKRIIIGEGITTIGENAFADNPNLESVSLPSTIISIDTDAFQRARSLSSINIPYGIEEIWDYAFQECDSLSEITIPDTVTYLGDNIFWGCEDTITVRTYATATNVIEYCENYGINYVIIPPTNGSSEITVSGNNATSIVTLDYDTANLRVTVPTVLPVTVDSDNNVTVSDNAQIVNYSKGQVDVTNAVLSGNNSWTLAAFDTDFTKVPVDTKQYGFKLQGYSVPVSGNAFNNQFDTIAGNSALDLSYDANVAIQSEAISDAEIGNIVFTVAWHK